MNGNSNREQGSRFVISIPYVSYAIKLNDEEAFNHALDHDDDINARDPYGDSPLMLCCIHGRDNMAEKLISRKDILINDGNHLGMTALMFAAYYGNVKIVRLLLQHPECEPELTDDHGNSALVYAAQKGQKEALLLLLPFATQEQKDRSLCEAVSGLFAESSRLLLEGGASLMSKHPESDLELGELWVKSVYQKNGFFEPHEQLDVQGEDPDENRVFQILTESGMRVNQIIV